MSGGDGNSESNTGPGHNGGTTGSINGSSDNGSSWGGSSDSGVHVGGMSYSTPTASDVASQYNGYGGDRINSSDVSNIRSDGRGGYTADINGHYHTVTDSDGGSETSNTFGDFSSVLSFHGGNSSEGSSSTNPDDVGFGLPGLSVSHGHPGFWGYKLITSDEETNYYLKVFVPYGDSLASQAALASQNLLDAKQAEEAARKAAEEASEEDKTAAQQAAKDAEEARQNAELAQQKQQRLVATALLFSRNIQAVRGLATVSEAVASPVSFSIAGMGGLSFAGTSASALASRIAAVITAVSEAATASLAGPVMAALTAFFYSPSLNTGENIDIGRDVSALIPADLLGLPDTSELENAWQTSTPVTMPVRGALDVDDSGRLTVGLVGTSVAGSVHVGKAVKDEQTGYYSYALPDIPGVPRQTILISPADAPGVNAPTTLTGPVPLPEVVVDTGDYDGDGEVPANNVLPSPWPLDNDFNDIILIFPPDSGLKPVYVMFRSPRNLPGTASGKGQAVGNNWLGGAGEGDGSPVPEQIADKLRGRTFSIFNSFRRAFWKAVAADPELSKQFEKYSIERIKLGRAPVVDFFDATGKRVVIELHHKTEISKGGGVYDVDNLSALTPKRHVEIHKGK